MRVFQTVLSGQGMRAVNVFTCIDPSAEEHGNERNLPGTEMRDVGSLKEGAEIVILQNSLVEALGSRLDRATSANQVQQVVNHVVYCQSAKSGRSA